VQQPKRVCLVGLLQPPQNCAGDLRRAPEALVTDRLMRVLGGSENGLAKSSRCLPSRQSTSCQRPLHAQPPAVLVVAHGVRRIGVRGAERPRARMGWAPARSCRSVILDAKLLLEEPLTAFCQSDRTLSEPVRTRARPPGQRRRNLAPQRRKLKAPAGSACHQTQRGLLDCAARPHGRPTANVGHLCHGQRRPTVG
jgi:hypothetical protein